MSIDACLLPSLPIFIYGGYHLASCGIQPIGFLAFEVLSDFLSLVAVPHVNIRGFPAHGKKQAALIPVFGEHAKFDPRAVRGQAPHNPSATQVNERIRATYRSR
jgi:hypothetical protein